MVLNENLRRLTVSEINSPMQLSNSLQSLLTPILTIGLNFSKSSWPCLNDYTLPPSLRRSAKVNCELRCSNSSPVLRYGHSPMRPLFNLPRPFTRQSLKIATSCLLYLNTESLTYPELYGYLSVELRGSRGKVRSTPLSCFSPADKEKQFCETVFCIGGLAISVHHFVPFHFWSGTSTARCFILTMQQFMPAMATFHSLFDRKHLKQAAPNYC